MSVGIYILNYNGRDLLEQCLPSVLEAAAASRHACTVTVVDNSSTDDSLLWLAQAHPQVAVDCQPNRGLSSYNDVLIAASVRVAVLINNDIRLAADCIDHLVEPLLAEAESSSGRTFMAAPRSRLFDGQTYEGYRTAVGWRWGLVQATALFPGHEQTQHEPGLTASAGAALAVDRQAFIELGGFDPLYLPGRIEDLDLAFRGYMAGWHARYVPSALVFHRGQATFERELGADRSLLLALRNTLLFQWKNLRHPLNVCRQAFGLAIHLAYDLLRAPLTDKHSRLLLWRALGLALARRGQIAFPPRGPQPLQRERDYFLQFAPARMATPDAARVASDADEQRERQLALRHPISRWYLCPLASWASRALRDSSIRPIHCTLAGLAMAMMAGLLIVALSRAWLPLAALAVLASWLFDRLDGSLARRQRTTSAHGAWLDANIDELADLGLQACIATRLWLATQSAWPWLCFAAFVCGKYLLVYGLNVDAGTRPKAEPVAAGKRARLQRLVHLPGNTDVRIHLLVAALLSGWLGGELMLLAVYYNARWLLRYARMIFRPRLAWSKGAAS